MGAQLSLPGLTHLARGGCAPCDSCNFFLVTMINDLDIIVAGLI